MCSICLIKPQDRWSGMPKKSRIFKTIFRAWDLHHQIALAESCRLPPLYYTCINSQARYYTCCAKVRIFSGTPGGADKARADPERFCLHETFNASTTLIWILLSVFLQ